MPVYVSDRLTATLGVVRGSPTPTRLIQWFRGSTVIAGANTPIYTITSADIGQPISVRQTESNYFGSAVATSAATEDVQVFDPSILFSASEPGVWFDPTDAANLAWRRNLLLQTQEFDNAAWVKAAGGVASAPIVTANAGTDPLGGSTADRVQFSLNGGTVSSDLSQLRQTVQTDSVSTYTFSFYAKSFDGSSSYQIIAFGAPAGAQAIAITGTWTRFTVTGAGTNINYSLTLRGGQTPTNSNTADILLWGAQLELGSVATTYQPITNLDNEVIAQFPNATLYQDSIGTIPVYAPEQPVGLMLDKSKGLVLGPELVTNGNFANPVTTGWVPNSATIAVVSGQAELTSTVSGTFQANYQAVTVSGRTYKMTATLRRGTCPQPVYFGFNGVNSISTNNTTDTTVTIYLAANGPSTNVQIYSTGASVGSTLYFDNITVKELPGNHATQSTAISRPLYGIVPQSGRRNLLTWTEQFNVIPAPWGVGDVSVTANTTTAPDGTTTADKLVELATTGLHFISQTTTIVAGANTFSVYLKAAERQFAFLYHGLTNTGFSVNLATGATGLPASSVAPVASSVTLVGDGWYRVSMTVTATAGAQFFRVYLSDTLNGGGSYTGNGTSGLFAWGAQVEVGSTATAYQKVTTDYDVTEAGVASVGYLRFDGTNDGMLTNSITPGTDKAQVFTGVRKNSDATGYGTIVELGIYGTNNGSFSVSAPGFAGQPRYEFSVRGTANSGYEPQSYAAPINNILTSLMDIGAATQTDELTPRINAVVNRTNANGVSAGTGNFGNYAISIGRNNAATLAFNGQMFPMIVRFGPNMSSALVRTTENWVASKTAGVTLP